MYMYTQKRENQCMQTYTTDTPTLKPTTNALSLCSLAMGQAGHTGHPQPNIVVFI